MLLNFLYFAAWNFLTKLTMLANSSSMRQSWLFSIVAIDLILIIDIWILNQASILRFWVKNFGYKDGKDCAEGLSWDSENTFCHH